MSELKEGFDSVDDLLSANLDDLADLPAFETPPAGAYLLGVRYDVKKVNNKDAVEASYRVEETVELEDKSGETAAVAKDTKFSQLFMLDNKFGIGNLKKSLAPYAAHFGTNNIGKLIRENLNEEVLISGTIKVREDKNDPDKKYASVQNVTVA